MIHIDVHGTLVPALGLGTYQLEGPDAQTAVEHALDVGYRHLDTAEMYGNERAVGAGLKASGVERESVFLTTKVWRDNLRYRAFLNAAEASLKRLATEYMDLLLVHWPNERVELAETLDALQEARHRGYARLIGVSNFPPGLLDRALQIVPDLACDQVEYHPFLGQEPLLEVVRAAEMMLTAYSPIARGQVKGEETLKTIGERYGKSSVQITLRWHLQQERVATIPKASTAAHRAANFDVFDFALTDAEMTAIHGLARGERLIDPGFAPDWDR